MRNQLFNMASNQIDDDALRTQTLTYATYNHFLYKPLIGNILIYMSKVF